VRLGCAFWPGPLTLVVPDGAGGFTGWRCPDCEVTLALLRRVGVPVAAPSANRSGEPPAHDAGEVLAAFDGEIAAVLDGGRVGSGVASTVVRVDADGWQVLREGEISRDELLRAWGRGSGPAC
jgi:L-threonylcarbamoyladenylate synthase